LLIIILILFQAILKISEWLGPLFPPTEPAEGSAEATEEQKKRLFVDDDVVIENKYLIDGVVELENHWPGPL